MAVQQQLLLCLIFLGSLTSPASCTSVDLVPSGVGENFVVFPGNTACSEFEELVTKSGHLWLLLFKKAYCPWCKEFDFEWQAASFDLRSSPRVRFGEVDIHRCGQIAAKFGAKSAPTTILVSGDNFETYSGPKSASGIVSAANMALKRWKVDLIGHFDEHVPIKIVDSISIDLDVLSNTKPTMLMVSSRWPPPPVLLDPRFREFGIQCAFASHDVQMQSRLDSLSLITKHNLQKIQSAMNESITGYQEAESFQTFLEEVDAMINYHHEVMQSNKKKKKGNHRRDSDDSKQSSVYLFPPKYSQRLPLPSTATLIGSKIVDNVDQGVDSKNSEVIDAIPSHTALDSETQNEMPEFSDGDNAFCDSSCDLWQLDIHALNIRSKPSVTGSMVGVVKKGNKFFASCELSPSGTEDVGAILNPHCMWLRMCTCNQRLDSRLVSEHDEKNINLEKAQLLVSISESSFEDVLRVTSNSQFITRVGDISDTSSLRATLADTDRMMFQISPVHNIPSSDKLSVVTKVSVSPTPPKSNPSSPLVTLLTDWIYSHMSLWYLPMQEDSLNKRRNRTDSQVDIEVSVTEGVH